MDGPRWPEDAPTTTLLRLARGTYRSAVRHDLAAAEADDLPRHGVFVLASIARTGAPLGEIIEATGVSKQAGGQLIDTLVLRGYLERTVDPGDRRRLVVTLTERGTATAEVIREAFEGVDDRLRRAIGDDQYHQMRAGLMALLCLDDD